VQIDNKLCQMGIKLHAQRLVTNSMSSVSAHVLSVKPASDNKLAAKIEPLCRALFDNKLSSKLQVLRSCLTINYQQKRRAQCNLTSSRNLADSFVDFKSCVISIKRVLKMIFF